LLALEENKLLLSLPPEYNPITARAGRPPKYLTPSKPSWIVARAKRYVAPELFLCLLAMGV